MMKPGWTLQAFATSLLMLRDPQGHDRQDHQEETQERIQKGDGIQAKKQRPEIPTGSKNGE